MRILQNPPIDNDPPSPRSPGWWRRLWVHEGTIVDFRGSAWKAITVPSYDGLYSDWQYIGSTEDWLMEQIEVARQARSAAMPKRGPKGRAGDSGAAR